MNYFHLEAKVVSRGAGRSVIAAAAYASCSRLYNDYDGLTHDYTRKQGCLSAAVCTGELERQTGAMGSGRVRRKNKGQPTGKRACSSFAS